MHGINSVYSCQYSSLEHPAVITAQLFRYLTGDKTYFLLHVHHKFLNVKTTHGSWLGYVNDIVLFIHKNSSYILVFVHSLDLPNMAASLTYRKSGLKQPNAASTYVFIYLWYKRLIMA